MFPQLEGKMEYFEVGSPLTNIYYLGTEKGEVYGADHDTARFSLEAITNLRPDIGVPGLYLTGQDILTCGFSGAMYGGLLCAMSVTRRNLMEDLVQLTKKIKKEQKCKKD
jgi:all-trans-retinol 13,14-reductase